MFDLNARTDGCQWFENNHDCKLFYGHSKIEIIQQIEGMCLFLGGKRSVK